MEETENISIESQEVIDEAMLEMGDFIAQMADVDGYLEDIEMGTATRLQHVEMEMPLQLDMHVNDDGSLVLGGSPPLYYVSTTVSPVFHQFKVKIHVTENDEQNASSDKQGMES
jgi:hypothetical protein